MEDIDFPEDLVRVQRAYNAVYRTLAGPQQCDSTALRRRLLRLSVRLWWHPYWSSGDAAPGARARLRALPDRRSPDSN